MIKKYKVILLLAFIILTQTACGDLIIDVMSKKFSEWAVNQFGAIPMIIVGVVGILVAIVWGIIARRRRSREKQ